MRRYFAAVVLALALATPVMISGCEGRVRVYDAEYRDYHVWNGHERVYYQRWEVENHRNHMDFDRRSEEEKREYWKWRHSHEDHDHHDDH
jgi:tRNA(Phe) wybutosine-synthesizing methylase Tyw3